MPVAQAHEYLVLFDFDASDIRSDARVVIDQVLADASAPTELRARGRHDPCVLPRAVPMVEAMAALVVVDHALRQRGQCG